MVILKGVIFPKCSPTGESVFCCMCVCVFLWREGGGAQSSKTLSIPATVRKFFGDLLRGPGGHAPWEIKKSGTSQID